MNHLVYDVSENISSLFKTRCLHFFFWSFNRISLCCTTFFICHCLRTYKLTHMRNDMKNSTVVGPFLATWHLFCMLISSSIHFRWYLENNCVDIFTNRSPGKTFSLVEIDGPEKSIDQTTEGNFNKLQNWILLCKEQYLITE